MSIKYRAGLLAAALGAGVLLMGGCGESRGGKPNLEDPNIRKMYTPPGAGGMQPPAQVQPAAPGAPGQPATAPAQPAAPGAPSQPATAPAQPASPGQPG